MKNKIKILLVNSFLIILISCSSVKYQIEEFSNDFQRDQAIIKIDSTYLYIDNSPEHWYTFEIFADKIVQIENSQNFITDHKFVQMNSMPFNIGTKYIVKGSLEAERYALFKNMRWERNFQEKTFKCDLEEGSEYYTNKKGKQFLIWWWKTPRNSPTLLRQISNSIESDINSMNDSISFSQEVDYQLNLCYVIQGAISASLNITVLENDNLEFEIMKLKKIADTFNFYGYYIDLEKLIERLENNNSYIFEDSLKTFSIKIPEFVKIPLNMIEGNYQLFTLPEKNGIINAVGVGWYYKNEFKTFDEYITDHDSMLVAYRDNICVLEKSSNKRRITFTENDGYFHCQEILIENEDVYLFLLFTATKETYNFNLERFLKLAESVN